MNGKTTIDSSNFTNELKLLLECLKNEFDILSSNINEQYKNIDWNLFLKLARHHRVYPVVYPKVKTANWIPSYVMQSLYNDYRKNTFTMLKLSGEIESISKILSENKIDALFLKGPILAADLYGDISQRTSSDIDMLVNLNDLERIDMHLNKIGYVKNEYIESVLNDWKWRHHHFVYFHSEKKIKLEIHWRLNPGPAKEPTFMELWGRKKRSSLTTYPIYCLGNEDLFLFLASHGARHGWSRLRWLVDIDRLSNKILDRSILNKLMQKYHYTHVAGQSLVLASALLNTPLNNNMKFLTKKTRAHQLAQEALFYIDQFINLHDETLPIEVSSYHKKHLFSLMSFKNKILFILSFIHPYYEDAKTLHLPKKFHFLYFPLRPFLWVWRKTKAQRMFRRV